MRLQQVRLVSALALLALLSLSQTTRVISQATSGTIEGRVTDSGGGALPGVTVTATGVTVGGRHTAATDMQGVFRLFGLLPDTYTVRAELAGFLPAARTSTVVAGQVSKLELMLAVGGVTETVVVTAEAATISFHAASVVMRPHWRAPSAPFRTTSFDKIDEPAFVRVTDAPLSTFSVDVDTASYAYLRRALTTGRLPPPDAVRIEELLNYFRYDYPKQAGTSPISVTTDVGRCPWEPNHLLLHIGLQAREPDRRDPPRRNLVFLLDVSGSMQPPDKLPLVKSAMGLLVNHLTTHDTVAIVVYAGSSGLVLPATRGDEQARIHDAIGRLHAGGTTNGAEGIQPAYQVARENFVEGGVNRVVLATDGDFNIGVTSRGDLLRLIEDKRKTGIYLSVLGVGDDNLKDGTMEQLADRGNGNYAYLDSLEEAQKVLVREAASTLVPVAGDVKIQVEFNPRHAAAYRLIGYENRALRTEDFRDDRKDAGEMGAGTSVTALYELVLDGEASRLPDVDSLRYQQERGLSTTATSDEIATVKLRYKRPGSDRSEPLEVTVRRPARVDRALGDNLGFSSAVAAFGMLLRDSPHKGRAGWRMVADLARQHRGADPDGYRAQFVRLVEVAEGLERSRQPADR